MLFRSNVENQLVCSRNRKAFFSYVKSNITNHEHAVCLCVNGDVVSDSTAANLLLQEFRKNFSGASDVSSCINAYISEESAFQPYCSELLIAETLKSIPTTNSSPDGISFKILKMFS